MQIQSKTVGGDALGEYIGRNTSSEKYLGYIGKYIWHILVRLPLLKNIWDILVNMFGI